MEATPVVYTFDHLKEIYDRNSHGVKGQWGAHAKLHTGHKECCKQINDRCDWVLGIVYENFAAGQKILIGSTEETDSYVSDEDLDFYKNNSDVVLILRDDYHPFLEYMSYIDEQMSIEFPKDKLKKAGVLDNLNLYASLYYSVAIRIVQNEIYKIITNQQVSCGRDRWRTSVGYTEWLYRKYNLTVHLIDPIRDQFGNCMSGCKNKLPAELKNRINIPLLLPHFNSINDVREHIKNIKDLEIRYFYKENGWMQAKFYFSSLEDSWWSEGMKYEVI